MNNTYDSAALALQKEKLISASEHVSSNWIPLNLNLLEEILQKLDTNYYKENKNALIADLKCDIGLFTFSIKELSAKSDIKQKSVFDSLKNCDNEELKAIIRKCKKVSVKQSFSNASAEQTNQLVSLLTSSAVTETLANAQNADCEMAFLSAVFRQVGLTFIAWNYPNIFKNCLASASSEEELTEHLNRALGFSPAMLGVRLAKEWQVPSQVIRLIDIGKAKENEGDSASEMLIKLCKIGELLASLNNDNYPSKPEGAWNQARNEILKNLGSKGFKLIEENTNRLCKYYLKSIPAMSGPTISQKIEQANKSSSTNSLYHSNAYAQFLASEIQNEMRDFYSLITPEGLSKDSVTFLHGKLIPLMGFTQGCLYLIDPATHSLQPRLAFGTTKAGEYESISLIAHENNSHPLVKAFNSSVPVPKYDENEQDVKYYCGSLGSLQKAGVLYLELSQALKLNNKVNPMLYFRALIRALEDCLGLR
jgi:hypothetical protein